MKNYKEFAIKSIGISALFFLLILGVMLFLPTSDVCSADQKNILFILDGSGSMWGQIDGKAKIAIARDVMRDLIKELPEDVNAGLQAYGHRREGDCDDIEVLVSVGKGDKDTLIKKIQSIKPKGKTPITKSLKMAGDQLEALKGESAVILVSDGKETCEGDPCELVRNLKEKGINVKVHVVGFDVTEEEKKQLSCIAEAGEGKYFTAKNAGQLKEALTEVKKEIVSKPKGKIFYSGSPKNKSSGQCLYVWHGDHPNIYSINADGSNEIRLTKDTSYNDMDSALSPDGKRIAFVSDRDHCSQKGNACYNIFIMDVDGSNITRLTDVVKRDQANDPAWSPDGERIAFTLYKSTPTSEDDRFNIYVMNSDGTNKKRLTSEHSNNPAWSPDGKRIAFSGSDGVYVMNSDGTNKKRLTSDYSRNQAWSPEGKRIAFTSPGGIYVMNADGTNRTQLIQGKIYDEEITWSPDGNYIAFDSRKEVGKCQPPISKIYIMNADGTNVRLLTDQPGTYFSPSWWMP